MEQIPDAPWIRETERDGFLPFEPVFCPVCGEECESIFTTHGVIFGDVVGCENCLTKFDAYDWLQEKRESEREE